MPLSKLLCSAAVAGASGNSLLVCGVNDNRCRYHRKNSRGKSFRLLDSRICPLAYMSLYPALLALHCNRDKSRLKFCGPGDTFSCPLGPDKGVLFRVYSKPAKPTPVRLAKILASRALDFFVPAEIPDRDVFFEVVSGGECAFALRTGMTFKFYTGGGDELCPAALNSVYPLMSHVESGGTAHCPDYRTNIRFSKGAGVSQGDCGECSARVRLLRSEGDFHRPPGLDKWMDIQELVRLAGVRCLSSFHVALPYFFTLLNGGRLGYLTRDKNSAGIVCPNSSAGVRYFASRDGAGVYRQRAFFSEADCPSEIRAGEEIIIKDFETGAPFYYSLSVLFCAMREARRHPEFFAGEDISVRFKLAGARLDWGVRF